MSLDDIGLTSLEVDDTVPRMSTDPSEFRRSHDGVLSRAERLSGASSADEPPRRRRVSFANDVVTSTCALPPPPADGAPSHVLYVQQQEVDVSKMEARREGFAFGKNGRRRAHSVETIITVPMSGVPPPPPVVDARPPISPERAASDSAVFENRAGGICLTRGLQLPGGQISPPLTAPSPQARAALTLTPPPRTRQPRHARASDSASPHQLSEVEEEPPDLEPTGSPLPRRRTAAPPDQARTHCPPPSSTPISASLFHPTRTPHPSHLCRRTAATRRQANRRCLPPQPPRHPSPPPLRHRARPLPHRARPPPHRARPLPRPRAPALPSPIARAVSCGGLRRGPRRRQSMSSAWNEAERGAVVRSSPPLKCGGLIARETGSRRRRGAVSLHAILQRRLITI